MKVLLKKSPQLVALLGLFGLGTLMVFADTMSNKTSSDSAEGKFALHGMDGARTCVSFAEQNDLSHKVESDEAELFDAGCGGLF